MQALRYRYFLGGMVGFEDGTSASSPTFASVIALINDQLVAAGKPVLGFLNPWLYSTASSAFTDITIGKNVGFTCPDTAVSGQRVRYAHSNAKYSTFMFRSPSALPKGGTPLLVCLTFYSFESFE